MRTFDLSLRTARASARATIFTSILMAFGLQPANGLEPGAVHLDYRKLAGPVAIVGDHTHGYRVLVSKTLVFEDRYAWSLTIAAAFPDWKNPSTVVLALDDGGNLCASRYRVLDVRTRKITAEFGNCWRMALRRGSQDLVFAFADEDAPRGWTYGSSGLALIPRLTSEQHIRTGTAAYHRGDFDTALRHLWLVRAERFPEGPYLLGLMAER